MFDLDKPLNETQIAYVIGETLEALAYLHDQCHVIHRDMKAIKKKNILFYSISAKAREA